MTNVERTIKKGPEQTETIVFLWSVRRDETVAKDTRTLSANFLAFGRVWQLMWCQHPQGDVQNFGVYLVAHTALDEDVKTRFDIFVRNEMLGADLVRTRILKVFNTPDKSWGPRYPALTAWRRGFNDTVVVGVAVYPPKTPIPTKFTLPPQTATSSFLHQAEDTTTLSLFTHQIPALEYGTFSHLLVDSKTSDISFVVEDQEIPAHKNVLKSERAGPYFAGLLAHSFKENSDGRVTINDMAYKTFKAIFEYIYTGRTAVNAADDLFELYCAADRFQITSLLAYIKGELILFLNNNLPKPNDLLSLIRRLQPYPDLSEAVRICVSGVLDKWDDVQASQQWGALVTGPGGKEFVETLLSEAARLHKQSKPAGNAKTGA